MFAAMYERGNGFADAGDYAPGDDGQLYRIVAVGRRIETGRPGEGNRIEGCKVELADWSDCPEDEERSVLLVVAGATCATEDSL